MNVEQYHIFKIAGQSYIYCVYYKQLYMLSQQEFDQISVDPSLAHKYINAAKSSVDNTDSNEPIISNRKGLFLCVTSNCNARCVYCFADHGSYGKDIKNMDLDTAKKAIDVFIDNLSDDADAFINFFGGEPLLAFNTVKESYYYAISKPLKRNQKLSFRIVTNATLLTSEIIDFIAEHDIGIGISLDGGKYIQDLQRPLANGKSSFDEAIKFMPDLLSKIPYANARGTYFTFDYPLVDIYRELFDVGFKIVDVPPDLLNIKNKEEAIKMVKQIESLYELLMEDVSNLGHLRIGLIKTHIMRIFTHRYECSAGCGPGEAILAVDPSGNFYPCHRFISNSEIIGSISDGLVKKNCFDFSKVDQICSKCWNRYTCSHGCYYNNFDQTGDPYKRHEYWCMYSKKMTEVSLAVSAHAPDLAIRKILNLEGNS